MGLERLKETDEGTEEFNAAIAAGLKVMVDMAGSDLRAAHPVVLGAALREGLKAAITAAQDREAEMQRAGEEAVEEFLTVIHAKADQMARSTPETWRKGVADVIDSTVHMLLAELDGCGHGQYSLIMRHEKSGLDVDITRYGMLHEQMKRVAG